MIHYPVKYNGSRNNAKGIDADGVPISVVELCEECNDLHHSLASVEKLLNEGDDRFVSRLIAVQRKSATTILFLAGGCVLLLGVVVWLIR